MSTGKKIAGYVLEREVGRGGMSIVYAARDERTGQTVALKMLTLPPAFSSEQQRDLITRFGREARAVAHLSHPSIVAIQDVGEQEGQHYLVMELLDGQTLRDRLAHGPLTPAQALPILSQIADAVDAVHAAGVIHRDIKPSNVMLRSDGTAKLLDFGVARQSEDTTITGTGAIVGSPAYMAPEQIRGEPGSPLSDLWALGALLYEMLAGRPPFAGPSIPSVLYQVTHEPPAPIIGLTNPVQRVLRRALDKTPRRRYPTARALAGALSEALPRSRAERTAIVSPSPRPATPPVRWQWVWLLLPVLLGGGLVALTHHRSAPAVPATRTPYAPRPVPAPGESFKVTITEHRPAKLFAETPKPHNVTSKAKRALPQRHHAAVAKHHASQVRRRLHRARFRGRRFTQRHSGSHFDPAASQRLQKFIYSPGF